MQWTWGQFVITFHNIQYHKAEDQNMYCAACLGTGSAIATRDRAVAVSMKDDIEPRKHSRSYIFLESVF